MTPRTGRPTDDPKDSRLMVRLSEEDREKLNYCHKATGKPKAEIVRLGIDAVYNALLKQETAQKEED